MEKESQLDKKERKWFAVYTKPKTEKKVEEQIRKYGYEVYLPLRKELRQWKDRIKKVEVPLFNSYVFVRVNAKEYYEIPKLIKGFVKFVTIGGQKIAVKDKEIETIKQFLMFNSEDIEMSNDDFRINEKVVVKLGQLKGLEGKLIEFRGKHKIAIRIESIGVNLLVEINKNAVEKTV